MATKKPVEKITTRRQIAHHEKDEQMKKYITQGAIGIIAIIVLLLGYGLFTEVIFKGMSPVATVNDTPITRNLFQSRILFQRNTIKSQIAQYQEMLTQFAGAGDGSDSITQQIQSQIQQYQSQLSADMSDILANDVLTTMIEEELVRQEAKLRGLTVTDEEIDLAIEKMIGYDRNVTTTTTISDTAALSGTAPMTEGGYKINYQNFVTNWLAPTKLTEAQFREMVATDLLKTKLEEALSKDIPTSGTQVELMYFTAPTQTELLAVQKRFQTGETPEDILASIQDSSTYTGSVSGGSIPWIPQNYLSTQIGPEVEKIAFNTPVSKTSEIVMEQDGRYYMVFVQGHEEDRPLEDWVLTEKKTQAYQDWLATKNQPPTVKRAEDWKDAVPPVTDSY